MSETLQEKELVFEEEITETSSIYQIAITSVKKGWKPMIELLQPELEEIEDTLARIAKAHKVKFTREIWPFYPLKLDLFNSYAFANLKKTKVVIIGQDPYPGKFRKGKRQVPQAMGLAFSCLDSPPASLKNIFNEAKSCVKLIRKEDNAYPKWKSPKTGDLTSWAKQGVLLINSSLTFLPDTKETHKDQWEFLIQRTIQEITSRCRNLVFMLWGRDAAYYARYVPGSSHKIIMTSHPSPLSHTKTDQPFTGSQVFYQCYQYQIEKEITPVIWSIPE